MIYEIINPSDPYTLKHNDFKIAAIANLILGDGSYGLEPEKDKEQYKSPIFLFGGAEEWFKEKFNENIKDILDNNLLEISKCLNSVLPMTLAERQELESDKNSNHEKLDTYLNRKQILDERRTSMNNIGERAWNLAEKLKKMHEERTEKNEYN